MIIKCYDNGGKTLDRYTVCYLNHRRGKFVECVGMNSAPFHPQGIGQHGEAMLGRHLGKHISFSELPPDCQRVVQQDLGVL